MTNLRFGARTVDESVDYVILQSFTAEGPKLFGSPLLRQIVYEKLVIGHICSNAIGLKFMQSGRCAGAVSLLDFSCHILVSRYEKRVQGGHTLKLVFLDSAPFSIE